MARYRSKHRGKYKSRLELFFATLCEKNGVSFEYEAVRFPFVKPSHYVPDWRIGKNVYIETKGYLAPSDRAKLVAFGEQWPDIRILLLFGNASNKLNSRSKTTYGQWATKAGFEWADIRDGLPLHWWKKYGKEIDYQKGSKRRRRQSGSNSSSES